jgi:hypothetical protein
MGNRIPLGLRLRVILYIAKNNLALPQDLFDVLGVDFLASLGGEKCSGHVTHVLSLSPKNRVIGSTRKKMLKKSHEIEKKTVLNEQICGSKYTLIRIFCGCCIRIYEYIRIRIGNQVFALR